MPQFAYEARDENGQLTVGRISADGMDNAGELLRQRSLFVVRVARERESRPVTSNAHCRATRAQVAWTLSQLSVMIETGIRLSDALDCLARQASEPRLRALLDSISASIQAGNPLSHAMEQFPRSFSASLVALIRASEMSGTLSPVLTRCSAYLMHELQVLRRVRAAMMYPAFMFAICLAVTAFLLTVILPRFAAVFDSRGALLPLPTQALMTLSDSLIAHWYLWLAGAVVVATAGFLWWRSDFGRRQRDYLVISIPVVGNVFNTLYQSRMFRTLAVLLQSGVALIDSIGIIRDVVPNRHYRKLWLDVDEHIRRGERLAEPLLESPLISEPVAQMIDSGDRSGKLGFVFSRLADFLEAEYDQAVKTASQFIEPCMILVMGGIIGFVAASLMLPLFQAAQVAAH